MSYPTYGIELTEAKNKVDMALAHKSMEYQKGYEQGRAYERENLFNEIIEIVNHYYAELKKLGEQIERLKEQTNE